ncbi:MAG TPA: hypothetical protein V6D20_24050, partial [Candidatus Obscuribacterales bacterium]
MLNSFTTVTKLAGTSCIGVGLFCSVAVSLEGNGAIRNQGKGIDSGTASSTGSRLLMSSGLDDASLERFPSFFLSQQAPSQVNPPYPPEARQAFMDSCIESAIDAGATRWQAEDYCLCSLTEIQRVYTFQEFSIVDRQIGQGQNTPDVFD